ncbi:hypothetical protein SAMN02745244_00336 [Tessaracoccus bendigoensis DSM 12906]|uniref:Glycoprotein n=1 Tax=Tessaracoccus bendigoensis DSM 12906 TaxID=1123357 RepID=A0A1M6B4N5_9ACTN|nr:DUF6049 family protein [Tessaracoccus bendigoensis]SHI43617.1 hypothetical protein SAMN02745244_00336 [Tessaracoccus bendigoensis DSM 12906]
MNLRRLIGALSAALLIVVVITVPAKTASADVSALDVRIDSVSTPVLDFSDPTQLVELKGTVTNTSTTPVTEAVVHFWRLPTPIRSAEQLRELRAAPPIGSRITDLPSLFEIASVGPGERVAFTVKASVAQLTQGSTPLTFDDATYLIGAQVRGLPGPEAERSIVGSEVFPITATSSPVASSSLVMLTTAPSWLPDGAFIDSSLVDQLGNGLETLLVSGERDDVQTAIDPALYDAAVRLSTEHTVAGEKVAGNGIALRWVQRVDALAKQGRLWRLPYGNPDLVRAAASGQLQQVLAWSRAASGSQLSSLDSIAVLDDPTADVVAQLGEFDTVVVRDATGAKAGPPMLIGAASETTSPEDGTALASRVSDEFLATRPPLHVIDDAAAAAVDAELGAWRTHIPLSPDPAEPLIWSPGDTQPWPDLTSALTDAAGNAELLADLTATPTPDGSVLGAMAWSAGFSDQSAAVAYVRTSSPAEVSLDKITLSAAGAFVMASRTSTFPATLTNRLDVPVAIGVRFTSDSPQRIWVPDVEPVTIEPGASVPVEVVPQASANGVALVQAQAVTTGGLQVGKPVTIEITASDFGRVGWIIIVVSGAVVLGGTAWRIRAVRREQAKASMKENSEPSQ